MSTAVSSNLKVRSQFFTRARGPVTAASIRCRHSRNGAELQEAGVFGALPGIVGTAQAIETIKGFT